MSRHFIWNKYSNFQVAWLIMRLRVVSNNVLCSMATMNLPRFSWMDSSIPRKITKIFRRSIGVELSFFLVYMIELMWILIVQKWRGWLQMSIIFWIFGPHWKAHIFRRLIHVLYPFIDQFSILFFTWLMWSPIITRKVNVSFLSCHSSLFLAFVYPWFQASYRNSEKTR